MIPSLSTGAVGSRFVSQNDVDTAKARRDEQWKAAYARYVNTCLFTNLSFKKKTPTQARPGTTTPATRRLLRWT